MKQYFRVSPSADWEEYGRSEPYFGVLSNNKFRGKIELCEEDKIEFFKSGDNHINKCLETVSQVFGRISYGRAMDFGCGVGRLTNALSRHFDEVVGYDISESMLGIANKISSEMGKTNVTYVHATKDFNLLDQKFDFVHSYIVLQHIPVKDGMVLIDKMISSLSNDGIGALHMTFSSNEGGFKEKLKNLFKEYYFLRATYNLIKGKSLKSPAMQMNRYDYHEVFSLFSKHGIDRFFCDRVDDWGNVGIFIFFRKGNGSKSIWSNPIHKK